MADRIIVDKTLDPWTSSDRYYDYIGQMFKNTLTEYGWTLEKTPFEVAEAAVWAGIASVLMKADKTGAVKKHVEEFINNMEKTDSRGSYHAQIFPINGDDFMFGPDENGYYYTRLYGGDCLVRLYLNDGSRVQIGPTGTEIETSGEFEPYVWYTIRLLTNWIAGDEKLQKGAFTHESMGPVQPTVSSFSVDWWMLKRKGVSFSIEHSYSGKIDSNEFQNEYTFAIGSFDVDAEDVIIEFSYDYPQLNPLKRHIGDDVKDVQSITGGNGADAGLSKPTTQMLGQGGNGGHGGGGAGAGGTCKMETIHSTGVAEIDTSQAIGTMVNGSPGLGSSGTPGHSGGCIIYY